MKAKVIICCLLASVLMTGTAALNVSAVSETGDNGASVSDNETASGNFSFEWDRSDDNGITLNFGSSFDEAVIIRNHRLFASTVFNRDLNVEKDQITIGVSLLAKLDDGENTIDLRTKEKTFTISINVTDKHHKESSEVSEEPYEEPSEEPYEEPSEEESELWSEDTVFEWDRNSGSDICIMTNSFSKEITVRSGTVLSSSFVSKTVSINDGQIIIGADFLKKLDIGENDLVVLLKEGKLNIKVIVSDSSTQEPSEEKTITAEETYLTWDRSDLIGVAVRTNSGSRNVVVTKDGEAVFSNKDRGVYITLGRVGITAQYLKKLANGENHLVFEFDDGDLPVTINVTDRKNRSGSSTELTADKTVFTWIKNSSGGISIKTNSVSDTASVRKSGMLSLISKSSSVYIENGVVTLTPEYLNTLSEGKNNLTLVMEDGSIDIVVNVLGNVIEQSDNSKPSYTSSSSYVPGDYPNTGSTALAAGAAVMAASAGSAAIIASKRRKKDNKKQ